MCSGSCAPRPAEAGETGRGAGASPRATQRSETGRYPHKDTVQLLAEPLQLAMPDTWPGACRLADLYAHQLGRTGLRIRAYSAQGEWFESFSTGLFVTVRYSQHGIGSGWTAGGLMSGSGSSPVTPGRAHPVRRRAP